MLKKPPGWARSLVLPVAVSGLFVGLIVLASYTVDSASVRYQDKCLVSHAATTLSSSQQNILSDEDCKDPKKYMPWWYKLIAWPEGITTWAVIATLFTIMWQSNETRKQAKIANQTLIAQFRPRVIVRDIRLLQGETDWRLRLQIENLGGTNASIVKGELEIRWKVLNSEYVLLHKQSINAFELLAGEEFLLIATMTDNDGFDRFNRKIRTLEEGMRNTHTMQAIGTIRYKDDSGVSRKTGFCRNLDIKTQRFCPAPNSEDGYQD